MRAGPSLLAALTLAGCAPGPFVASTEQEREAIVAAIRGCGVKIEDPNWFWIREFKQWEFNFDTDAAGMARADCIEEVKERMIAARNLDVAVGYSQKEQEK